MSERVDYQSDLVIDGLAAVSVHLAFTSLYYALVMVIYYLRAAYVGVLISSLWPPHAYCVSSKYIQVLNIFIKGDRVILIWESL